MVTDSRLLKTEILILAFKLPLLLEAVARQGISDYTRLPVLSGHGVHGDSSDDGLVDTGYAYLFFLIREDELIALREAAWPLLEGGGMMFHQPVTLDYPNDISQHPK